MKKPLLSLCALAVVLASPALARAQAYPTEVVLRPLTLPSGMAQLRLDLDINMSRNAAGKPIVLAPDLYYGVSSDLTIGVDHVRSLCLSGQADGCRKTYDDVGFDLLYSIARGSVGAAFHGGVYANVLDPVVLQGRVGVLLNIPLSRGKAHLYLDPQLLLGMNRREEGNRDGLAVPVTFVFQPNQSVAPFIVTGMYGPLDGFGDAVRIPGGGGVLFAVSSAFDLGASFTFTNLLGKGSSTDYRSLDLFMNVRF